MILYIHGFGGSKNGRSTTLLRKHLNFRVEGLDYDARDPEAAIEHLTEQCEKYEKKLNYKDFSNNQLLLLGSSLGGFYAAQVAAKIECKLVLFNPSLNPEVSLQKYKGTEISTPTGERIFKSEHVTKYDKYSGESMIKTFETLRRNQFGIDLITTNDPIVDPTYSQKICKGFSDQTHFKNINEHRLTEEAVLASKEDISKYYHAIWG